MEKRTVIYKVFAVEPQVKDGTLGQAFETALCRYDVEGAFLYLDAMILLVVVHRLLNSYQGPVLHDGIQSTKFATQPLRLRMFRSEDFFIPKRCF